MHEVSKHVDWELTEDQALAIVTLVNGIWPSEDKTIQEMVLDLLTRSPKIDCDSVRYVIWDGDQAVVHARTFARRILTPEGAIEEMALAGVCVHPNCRGGGLGAMIARSAFERVDNQLFPISLFQTGVPDFYLKLGARVIDNRFVNSKNKAAPNENPWWDTHVMIYPSSYGWTEGTIDLNGPGY